MRRYVHSKILISLNDIYYNTACSKSYEFWYIYLFMLCYLCFEFGKFFGLFLYALRQL